MTMYQEEWKSVPKKKLIKKEEYKQFPKEYERHPEKIAAGWNKHYGKEELSKARLNLIEFGRTADIPPATVVDEAIVTVAYSALLKDFFKTKEENFPDWPGLPEIKSTPNATLGVTLSWYAAVPKKFVIDPEQKKEEDLWNS